MLEGRCQVFLDALSHLRVVEISVTSQTSATADPSAEIRDPRSEARQRSGPSPLQGTFFFFPVTCVHERFYSKATWKDYVWDLDVGDDIELEG